MKTMAEVIREELRKGSYQMPGDTLPYETQANAIAAHLEFAGYGSVKTAGAVALRDAADDFEDSMGVGEFDEWARRDGRRWNHIEEAWEHQGPYMDWLRARAESLATP